jgi:hypothetical protein
MNSTIYTYHVPIFRALRGIIWNRKLGIKTMAIPQVTVDR